MSLRPGGSKARRVFGGATVADVAVRAGVAPSSVSRVLSGHPNVSPGLRERVEKAAQELSYAPDFNAASLRSGRTRSVGFVVRDLASPLYADILHGAEDLLRREGYSTLVANSDGDAEIGLRHLETFQQRRVDGLILSPDSDSPAFTRRMLDLTQAPIVLIDRDIPDVPGSDRLSAVQFDHYGVCSDAMALLLREGHERIAFLGGPLTIRPARERLRAYEDVLREAGTAFDPGLVITGSHGTRFATTTMSRLMSLPAPPTAIFAGGVQLAIGVLLAVSSYAPELRRQITVVSCDEVDLMRLTDAALVIVDRDREAIGRLAATRLLEMLDTSEAGSVHTLPTFLRVLHRESA